MSNYALINNDEIVNVAVIDDPSVVEHFATLYDEVVKVEDLVVTGDPPEGTTPWIGWVRTDKGAGKPFEYVPPPAPEPPAEEPAP